ncbi:hypothetical protein ACROYT_G037073 [Oculina patagonica]
MELLKERRKLILLADKSPYGWKNVVEYKHHDLADDEEDGKRSTGQNLEQLDLPSGSLLAQLTATTPQLSASQLPNLFSRVRPQSLSQRSSSGVCFACAVSLSLKAFNDSLKAQSVTWFTDNQNVVRIVNSGSKVHLLLDLAIDIYQSCLLNAINIDVQWIPRDLNSSADDVSKFIDYDDYTISDEVFYALDELWGPHSCDSYFSSEGTQYHRVFGCAMGSPVSAVIAELVMEEVEEKDLASAPVKPRWWRRYVDDSNACLKRKASEFFTAI